VKHGAFGVGLLVGLHWFAALEAQSLGDIARQGQERPRETTAGKRYSNEDLLPVPVPSAPPVARASEDPALASEPDDASEAKDDDASEVEADGGKVPSTAKDKRDETYWRTRASGVRALVQRQRDDVTQMETRLADLETADSPTAAREREVTRQALAKARLDLQFVLADAASLEQDAHAAKVPAEWIQ
jgi:hypothetical protein